MQRRNVKTGRKVVMAALAAALLFSGMNMELLAAEANGLPSAGVDYFLSSDATSVKNIKDEEEEIGSVSNENKQESSEREELPTFSATASAVAASVLAAASPAAGTGLLPGQEPGEEKVIEETMIATTTKTIIQKENELEAKKEEEGFKSLVIAKVNDYVNVRSIPGEDGEILGKLYDKSVGEFVSEQDGWYEITSGNVTGYVKAEYCVTETVR